MRYFYKIIAWKTYLPTYRKNIRKSVDFEREEAYLKHLNCVRGYASAMWNVIAAIIETNLKYVRLPGSF